MNSVKITAAGPALFFHQTAIFPIAFTLYKNIRSCYNHQNNGVTTIGI